MAVVKYTWNGADVMQRAKQLIGKSSFEIGLVVEAQAKGLSPVRTGRLVGSIHTVSADGQSTAPALADDKLSTPTQQYETHVGTSVEYAPYVEYGTRNTDAQAFLRPALDIAQGKALTIVEVNGKKYFGEYLGGKSTL
jgi:HK97 gp10 family phage protein